MGAETLLVAAVDAAEVAAVRDRYRFMADRREHDTTPRALPRS